MRWATRLSYLIHAACAALGLALFVSQLLAPPADPNRAHKHKHKHHKFPHFPWDDPRDGSRDEPDSPFHFGSVRNAVGLICTALVAALSNAAGIGGGPFFVPLYNIVVGFGLKAATGLSQAAIAGGSLASLTFNLAQRHPWDPTKPLVDLDLAVILTPALLLGVSVGVILNDVFPDWVITGLLVVLLSYMCKRTTYRGLTSWHEETQRAAAIKAAAAISTAPQPQLAPICTDAAGRDLSGVQTYRAPTTAHGRQGLKPSKTPQAGDAYALSGSAGQEQHAAGCLSGAGATSCSGAPVLAGLDANEQAQQGADDGQGGAAAPVSSSPAWAPQGQQQQQETHRLFPHLPRRLVPQQQQQPQSSGVLADLEPPSRRSSSFGEPHTPSSDARPGFSSSCLEAAFSRDMPVVMQGQHREARFNEQQHTDVQSAETHSQPQQALTQPEVGSLLPLQRTASAAQQWQQWQQHWRQQREQQRQQEQQRRLQLQQAAQRRLKQDEQEEQQLRQQQQQEVLQQERRHQQQQQRHDEEQPLPAGAIRQQHPCPFSKIKLLSLLLLWAGFLGLSAVDALLPLCTWRYVIYMLVFLGITLGVTAAFIRAIIMAPAESGQLPRTWQEAAVHGGHVAEGAADEIRQPLLPQEQPGSSSVDAAAPGTPDAKLAQAQVAAMSASVAGAAGVVAGMVGVGGGTMIGPILLEFGVHPQVAAATSTVLVFMSSSAATLSYWMQERLVMHFALVFAIVAALASLGGITAVAALVRRTGRPSLIVLLLAACMGVGGALAAVFGGLGVYGDVINGEGLGFGSICETY